MQKTIKSGQRLGIMGGTFNPIHYGHLRAAEEAAQWFQLDQVYFIPTAYPPHKSAQALVGYWHRLEMLKLAVAARPGFWASDLEMHLPQPSYTINTVQAFKKAWSSKTEIYFMAGLDSFMSISQWYNFRELLSIVPFVVFSRAGVDESFDSLKNMLLSEISPKVKWNDKKKLFQVSGCKSIYFKPDGRLAISSTDLRQSLESGASVRYLIPEEVRIYIEKQGLYRSGNPD